MYLIGVLLFVLGLCLSVALHELGHMLPAKAFGVRVPRYFIGFGPTLWSFHRGGTEYGVKGIPLGGFVQIIGMVPPAPGDPDGTKRSGRFADMVDQTRAADAEHVRPEDGDKVFYKLAPWKKMIVMVAGPFMNLVIASVILGGIVTLHGRPEADGVKLAAVVECVRPVTGNTADQTPCTAADKPSPAAAAGLKPGDLITSINGHPILSNTDVSAQVRPSAGKPVTIVVDRAGQTLTLTATPIATTMPVLTADGRVATNADGSTQTVTAGYIGTSNQTLTKLVKAPVTVVPGMIWDATTQTLDVVAALPAKVVGLVKTLAGQQERDPNGLQSVVGVGRIAGEVANGDVTGISSIGDRLLVLLSVLASLNMALFVFNLLPVPPLDGGYVVGAVWEAIKRGWAKIARRPDPGYVDIAKAAPLRNAMALVLIGLTVLLVAADLFKPISLG